MSVVCGRLIWFLYAPCDTLKKYTSDQDQTLQVFQRPRDFRIVNSFNNQKEKWALLSSSLLSKYHWIVVRLYWHTQPYTQRMK